MLSPALRQGKSPQSYNPSPTGCILYLPLWHPVCSPPIFTSSDIGQHTCTVTGADYGVTGRTFDGSDENINCGSPTILDDMWDGGGTIAAWVNVTSDGENNEGTIFNKVGSYIYVLTEGSGVELALYVVTDATDGTWVTDARVITIGTTTFVAVTYNADATGNNPILYVNGVAKANTEDGTPDNTRTSDAASNFLIGDNAASDRCFDGVISEFWAWKRILPATELLHIYNATKGRHS